MQFQLPDSLRRLGDHMNQEQQQNWGPDPNKITWDELCKRESRKNPSAAQKISSRPIFMSTQLHKMLDITGKYEKYKEILTSLRPEDAIHIPQLRVDGDGKIIDWNRSMCDLTGISASQVVGKTYADVLNEW